MQPISNATPPPGALSSGLPVTPQTVGNVPSSAPLSPPTTASLSLHSFNVLNKAASYGNNNNKRLAGLAKDALGAGNLYRSSNQPVAHGVQYEAAINNDTLLMLFSLKGKLSGEQPEYDLLEVTAKDNSGGPLNLDSKLDKLSPELIHMILDHVPNAGGKVTSLASSSKLLYGTLLDKTQQKAKCSALLDRLNNITKIKSDERNINSSSRFDEFNKIFANVDRFNGKEKTDLILTLARSIKSLEGGQHKKAFQLMLGLIERLEEEPLPPSFEPEHRAEQVHDRKQRLLNLVRELSLAAKGSDIDLNDERSEAFEELREALGRIDWRHDVSLASAALISLSRWYLNYDEEIGAERFGKLVKLADQNKCHMNDGSSADIVRNLSACLVYIEEDNDKKNHLDVLCGIGTLITEDRIKAFAMIGLMALLSRIGDDNLRNASRRSIDAVIGTITDHGIKKEFYDTISSTSQN